jgi:putative flippase GtrA
MIDATTRGQFLRYAMVGLVSNLTLYFAYLGLTILGIEPKIAMSVVYALGVAQTFLFNRTWSFRHDGEPHGAFARYVATYGFGYLLNLAVLWITVDQMGLPHEVVQGIMILSLAVIFFVLQKFWVFRPSTTLST